MNHRLELGSEKQWTRMTVRSELGIANDTPWFGLVIPNPEWPAASPNLTRTNPEPLSKQIARWLCDLAWSVRNIQFGALPLFELDEQAPQLGPWGTLHAMIANWQTSPDAETVLAWMMAADGWFLVGDPPLTSVLEETAFALELPTVRISPSPANTQTLVHALDAQSIPCRRTNARWDAARLECLQSHLTGALRGPMRETATPLRSAHWAA